MRLAYCLCLIALILLLNACGLPEQTTRSSASATATILTPGPTIAELLRQAPAAGKAVAVPIADGEYTGVVSAAWRADPRDRRAGADIGGHAGADTQPHNTRSSISGAAVGTVGCSG